MKPEKKDLLFKRPNPFDQVRSKPKFEILNRKIKGTKGYPGISKSKALEARKKTLLSTLKAPNKTSKFIDKRIGAKDPAMQEDEVMLKRFTAEASQARAQKSLEISLANELATKYSLTHKGRSLDEYDGSDFSAAEDEEEDSMAFGSSSSSIDKATVKSHHFGGFEDSAESLNCSQRKSKAEVMRELIAKSKAYKMERQRVKEENEEIREQLNEDFDEIRGLLFGGGGEQLSEIKNEIESEKEVVNSSEYDTIVRELAFEKRGKPTDRLKTEAEVAALERKRLEKLEAERVARMQVNSFEASSGEEESEFEKDDDEESEENSFNEESDDEESEENSSNEENEGEEDEVSDENSFNEESDQNNSHENSSNEESQKDNHPHEIDGEEDQQPNSQNHSSNNPNNPNTSENIDFSLPFIIPIPESYKQLTSLCHRPFSEVLIIIQRILTYHSPLAHPESKPQMAQFHPILMKFLFDRFSCWENTANLNSFANIVIANCKFFPMETTLFLRNSVFKLFSSRECNQNGTVSNSCLFTAKFILSTLSTSDFYNPVVTPMYILIAKLFEKGNLDQLPRLLFLADLFLTSQQVHSKRIMPELFSFLTKACQTKLCSQGADICFSSLIYSSSQEKEQTYNTYDYILSLLERIRDIYYENVAFLEIVEPFLSIQNPSFSAIFQDQIAKFKASRSFLQLHREKVKEISTLEPDFSVDSRESKAKMTEEQRQALESKKLRYQVKKEKKSLIKEIRRDNAFIASFKHKKRIEEDQAYRQKMNSIIGQVANEGAIPRKSSANSSSFTGKKQKLAKF